MLAALTACVALVLSGVVTLTADNIRTTGSAGITAVVTTATTARQKRGSLGRMAEPKAEWPRQNESRDDFRR